MTGLKTILFVSHKHPPSIGGMETHNFHLKLGLEKSFKVIPLIIKPKESRISFFWNIKSKMEKILHENHVDLVYVNDGLLALVVSGLKVKFPSTLFTATIHGLEATFPVSIYQKNILPRLNHYDLFIAVSNFTKNILDNVDGLSKKTICILNGIDHQVYQLSENEIVEFDKKYADFADKKVLLSVGRPVLRKGFSWFAQHVLPLLPDNVFYVVAGPLPKKSMIDSLRHNLLPKRLNHALNLALGYPEDAANLLTIRDNRLRLTGSVSYAELNYLIERADLFIVPNIEVAGDAEGFGLVALEGAIRAKVVIAAYLQGLKDAIIHSKNGIVILPKDVDEWLVYCKYYIENQDMGINFGKDAKNYTIQHYSWEKMSSQYVDAFYKLF
ncbi:MAG TPA: glycosyltransferase family 4 protein [Saprospiraceae bacterium]|nr:glycosyltransferase family 4 protein [Saprospiraceae bacterium]